MIALVQRRFQDTVSALAYSFGAAHAEPKQSDFQPPYNDLTAFILRQYTRLPDYLSFPVAAATLALDWNGFHRRPPTDRGRQIAAWKTCRLGFARDLIRYYETLATFALYSRNDPPVGAGLPAAAEPPLPERWSDVLVIGSGPGGSLTACLLAEGGYDVLLIEEGEFYAPDSCPPFTRVEMEQKYRHGGQTMAWGRPKVLYVEGCCVGGGSEINSGLYHRTPPEVLEHWRRNFDLKELTPAELEVHFEAIEQTLSVSALNRPAPPASLRLHEGAQQLGWKSIEVPRWFSGETRQSMTRTYLARFCRTGSTLLPNTRAVRIRRETRGWLVEAQHPSGKLRLHARCVFVCGGAIQTAALLLRSGIRHNIGRAFQLHPTVKVVARFPEPVNYPGMGVPVHQVKEFAPRLSFGCSISTPAHLALALLDTPQALAEVHDHWPQMAIYYAMITPEGRGSVRTLPGFRSPLVQFRLTENDHRNLADGLEKLTQLLRAAGAVATYPNPQPMTIHLFGSCPMGERKSWCATDSFGRIHGFDGLYVNDASLLCTAPGVNPQGTIMAIARRNVMYYLREGL